MLPKLTISDSKYETRAIVMTDEELFTVQMGKKEQASVRGLWRTKLFMGITYKDMFDYSILQNI